MEKTQLDPVDIVISQRSILAPNAGVFLGTGKRHARYVKQLDTLFLSILLYAAQTEGKHRVLCGNQYLETLVTLTNVTEKKINPIEATYVIHALARLMNSIKTNNPFSIRLSYPLPKGVTVNVSEAMVEFVSKHEGFLLSLYEAVFGQPSEVAVVEETKPEVEAV